MDTTHQNEHSGIGQSQSEHYSSDEFDDGSKMNKKGSDQDVTSSKTPTVPDFAQIFKFDLSKLQDVMLAFEKKINDNAKALQEVQGKGNTAKKERQKIIDYIDKKNEKNTRFNEAVGKKVMALEAKIKANAQNISKNKKRLKKEGDDQDDSKSVGDEPDSMADSGLDLMKLARQPTMSPAKFSDDSPGPSLQRKTLKASIKSEDE